MRKLAGRLFLCAVACGPWLPVARGGERGIGALFKRFDRDEDGKLTRQELRNQRAFDRLDANGDGAVTLAEAEAGLAKQITEAMPRKGTGQVPRPTITKDPGVPLPKPMRELDPVGLTGATVPTLIGREPSKIVAFAYGKGWRQIPVQVDERVKIDLAKVRGANGPCVTTVYADAKTKTGADTDPELDADDEIVFMYRDAGEKAAGKDPAGVAAGSRVELTVTDPAGGDPRYAYLFVSDDTLKPDAGQDLVSYTYKPLPGPTGRNQLEREQSVVKTARYQLGFTARWMHEETRIFAGDAPGDDILDGHKFQFMPGVTVRTTETFSRGPGAFIAHVDGPVRAIRSAVGANSGTFTQRDWICYEGRRVVRSHLRVHAVGGSWDYFDFSAKALGMRYHDNLNPKGVVIDGKPDTMAAGVLTWQVVTGKPGTMAMALFYDTDAPSIIQYSFYFDDERPAWAQGPGDAHAYAASGPATGPVPNSDPRRKAYRIVTTRVLYYDPPDTPLTLSLARIAAARQPLRVECTSAPKRQP